MDPREHPAQPADDATLVRPHASAPAEDTVRAAAPVPAVAAAPVRPAGRAELGDFLDGGANPLVRAANPLLMLSMQLRHSAQPPADLAYLREQAMAQVQKFESAAYAAGIGQQAVVAARYVLCTMVDESVSNSPWGDLGGWSQRTLLVIFHGEAYGGAKFFQILERLREDSARHLDLLELMYICLALGFGGRYLVEPGGQGRLADIQDDLYRRIRALREPPAAELAPHWRGIEDRRHPLMRHVPLWVAAAAAACLLLGAFLYAYVRLNAASAPASAQLARIGLDEPPLPRAAAQPAAPARKSLKQLLAPEERAGELGIEEQPDGRDTLRLAAAGLFPSGGTDIAAAQVPLLHRITWALNQVQGRLVVVGHTDDQPVRSLKFKDNFELSKARALSTVQILSQGLDDPRRLEASGAGSSQPIALPPGTPANRALNRRVEILYLPEN